MRSISAQRPVRSAFTLIEVVIAMAILVVISLALVGVVQNVQEIWSRENTRMRLSQNARLVFDVIARDVQAMAVSHPELAAGYFVEPRTLSDGTCIFAFPSTSGLGTTSSDLGLEYIEVGYGYNTDSQLLRWFSPPSNAAWNLTDTTWPAGFTQSDALCDGLYALTITPYDSADNPINLDSQDTLVMPSYIQVRVTLYDPEIQGLMDAGVVSDTMVLQSMRSFSRNIFTNRGE